MSFSIVRPADGEAVRAARAAVLGDLMRRFAAGDDGALDALYARLAPSLYRLCIALVGRLEASELLCDVFLKMRRARATFVPGSDVLVWSFAIARACFLARGTQRARSLPSARAPGGPPFSSDTHRLGHALELELLRLSEPERAAYVLVELEGLSHADVAMVLGCSTCAVARRLRSADQRLAQALGEAGW